MFWFWFWFRFVSFQTQQTHFVVFFFASKRSTEHNQMTSSLFLQEKKDNCFDMRKIFAKDFKNKANTLPDIIISNSIPFTAPYITTSS
jgi:hypothetical protein